MNRDEPVDPFSRLVVQTFVGRFQVGEQRIASRPGNDPCPADRVEEGMRPSSDTPLPDIDVGRVLLVVVQPHYPGGLSSLIVKGWTLSSTKTPRAIPIPTHRRRRRDRSCESGPQCKVRGNEGATRARKLIIGLRPCFGIAEPAVYRAEIQSHKGDARASYASQGANEAHVALN